jgi:uncharacterized protein (TIGR02996 family)
VNDILTAGDAILRAILEEPADDGLRLIYADYLEEHGEGERAEFIRVQVDLGTFDDAYYLSFANRETCSISAVRQIRRSAELLHEAWAMDLLALGLQSAHITCVNDWEFRRGFVSEVRCPLAAWMEHGEAVVKAHPVTRVVVTDREPASYPRGRWGWHKNNKLDTERFEQVLPEAIFDMLSGLRVDSGDRPDPDGRWTDYDSPELGRSDLDHAALMVMRERAKLPTWAWEGA